MAAPRLLAAAAAGLGLLASGCQNPFDPKADVRMWQFNANAGQVASIVQANATTTEQSSSSSSQNVSIYVLNYSSIGFVFDSYTVVYRQASPQTGSCTQPAGSPICSLGGPGGRRFPMVTHAVSVMNVANMDATGMSIPIHPMTTEMYDYIGANTATISGGLDLDITLNGTDDNGHDIKVGGTLHVEVY